MSANAQYGDGGTVIVSATDDVTIGAHTPRTPRRGRGGSAARDRGSSPRPGGSRTARPAGGRRADVVSEHLLTPVPCVREAQPLARCTPGTHDASRRGPPPA
jgi:hypothetical protein